MKALVTDTGYYPPDYDAFHLPILERAGVEVVFCAGHTREEILQNGRDCQGFTTASGVFDGPLFDQLPECQVVARYGIGVDTIDLAAATARGVVVCNVPDAIHEEVADHAMALILALWRRFPKADAIARGEGWSWPALRPIHRIRGLTLGLVGFGNISRAVASRARPFGFRVIAYDPYVSVDEASSSSVELVTFAELLARSDVVSVHTPLTDETRGLFDREAFRQMKPMAYFVNTARGKIHDEGALHKAIVDGEIAGAGLDVFEMEPPDPANPLLSLESVIVTPHSAGYSEEGVQQILENAAWNVVAVLKGFYPRSIVNPGVNPKPPLKPYPGDNRDLLLSEQGPS